MKARRSANFVLETIRNINATLAIPVLEHKGPDGEEDGKFYVQTDNFLSELLVSKRISKRKDPETGMIGYVAEDLPVGTGLLNLPKVEPNLTVLFQDGSTSYRCRQIHFQDEFLKVCERYGQGYSKATLKSGEGAVRVAKMTRGAWSLDQ